MRREAFDDIGELGQAQVSGLACGIDGAGEPPVAEVRRAVEEGARRTRDADAVVATEIAARKPVAAVDSDSARSPIVGDRDLE